MKNKYYEKLEFNEILNKLSTFCDTDVGKNFALNLLPSNDAKQVEFLLCETEEAVSLAYKASMPSFYNFDNIENYINVLNSEGTLSISSLLEIAKIFKLSNELKSYLNQDYIAEDNFPILTKHFHELYTNKEITKKVFDIITEEGSIDDRASANLNHIRKSQKKVESLIKEKLNSFLHKPSFSKYIQEPIVTIRNDRYVIPIKEEYRSQIKGFIHDISNAGSTVFIEPTSVFELNNELNNLKFEEEIEIEKILKELSTLFYPYTEELKKDSELIGKLDFIFAKAKYSKSINGITPKVNSKKQINLINARHPLIAAKNVVPISINLGKDFSTLVITGPNAGGKTVSLKTVGLLELMACSGLNIPADEQSSIYVFDQVYADIGDNQSIADSLSTFSSHILNIVDIVNNATSNSLVLVDELGSGTDPLEGANLAISILEHFNKKDSLVVATTHYQELKYYALEHEKFENACVEFDLETLSPTFNLLIGIPGKSNAFEISQKLGLSKEIIENGKKHLSSDDVHIEELLKSIYDNKIKTENARVQAEENEKETSELNQKAKNKLTEIENKEKEIIDKAKLKARDLLLDAKDQVSQIIKEANKSKTATKDLNNMRNNLNKDIKGLSVPIEWTTPKKANSKNDFKGSHSSVNYANAEKIKTVSTELNIIGLNVEEALPIVDKFLDDASLARLKTVRIVHGKGTGKLRKGVQDFLRKNSHVSSFRSGTFGEGEMGATIVELQ